MLCSLHIENIAVIKSADIDFKEGFTVLTGETGAGKSIIIDSINLICGAKLSRDIIRSGEDTATVSALFSDLGEDCEAALSELGIYPDEDGLIMFSRTISDSGKSTAKVNGRTIPISMQRDAVKYLIGIHGQHDNMALLQPENHISYLDEFALASEALLKYRESYDRYCELNKSIEALRENERDKAQRLEFLKYQIKEIEDAKLKEGEEEKLEARRTKLQNCEKIAQLSGTVYSLLYSNEKGNAAADKVRRATRAIEALSPVIPESEDMLSRLDFVCSELEDIAEVMEALGEEAGDDPTTELDRVEGRLEEISKLQRKYGDSVSDILAFLSKAKEQLEAIEMSEERLNELTSERDALMPILEENASVLTKLRNDAATTLSERIIDELSYLDMGGVNFSVSLDRRVGEDGKVSYNKNGVENIEFLISTNKGEPLKPLAKIASGGELSRIMLAIKSVLSEADSPGTLIFDEVDTGVSGKTSQKIGIKLKDLSRRGKCQVLCVTHSAQIAALAQNHYLITKSEKDNRVLTTVSLLTKDERVHEVARIMGGINITDRLIETAREMINEKI